MSDPLHDADSTHDASPSLAKRVLDLLLFAPAGAVLSTLDDVPAMASRGRAVIDQEVRNAHLVGRFAVGEGQRRLRRGLGHLARPGARSPGGAAATGPDATSPEPPDRDDGGSGSHGITAEGSPPPFVPRATVPPASVHGISAEVTADLAIPGYDTLSASQVVRRLDGLGLEELAAVFRHESATRGRRTILHRAQQLLGPIGHAPSDGA